MKPKSKIAAVLAVAPKSKESSPDIGDSDEGDESSSVTVDAAQALKDAMSSGSPEEIASAFKNMLSVCME